MIESLKPFGGKLVMVAPKPATVHYHGDAGAVSWIAEFPSVQHAQDWHDSATPRLACCRAALGERFSDVGACLQPSGPRTTSSPKMHNQGIT